MKRLKMTIKPFFGILFCFLFLLLLPSSRCNAAKNQYINKYQKTIFHTITFFNYDLYQSKKYKTNLTIEWNDAKYTNTKNWLINNGIKARKAKNIKKVRFQIKIKGKWVKSKYFKINLKEETVGFGIDAQFLLKQELKYNTHYPLKAQFVDSKNKVLYTQNFHLFVPSVVKFSSLSVKKMGNNQLKVSWPRSKGAKRYQIFRNGWNSVSTTYNNYYIFTPLKGQTYYQVDLKAISKYGPDNPQSSAESLVFYIDLKEGRIISEEEYHRSLE